MLKSGILGLSFATSYTKQISTFFQAAYGKKRDRILTFTEQLWEFQRKVRTMGRRLTEVYYETATKGKL